jgi:hypothetical protein
MFVKALGVLISLLLLSYGSVCVTFPAYARRYHLQFFRTKEPESFLYQATSVGDLSDSRPRSNIRSFMSGGCCLPRFEVTLGEPTCRERRSSKSLDRSHPEQVSHQTCAGEASR